MLFLNLSSTLSDPAVMRILDHHHDHGGETEVVLALLVLAICCGFYNWKLEEYCISLRHASFDRHRRTGDEKDDNGDISDVSVYTFIHLLQRNSKRIRS